MDDKKIAEDINRAELAHQIISNPVYIQAMQMIQAKSFSDFSETKANEGEQRHNAWLQMQSHKEFKKVLEQLIENGQFANEAKQALKADANFTDKEFY